MVAAAPPSKDPSDPWQELDRLFDDIRDRVLGTWNSAFPPAGATTPASPTRHFRTPAADVTDNGTSFRIVLELPGVPKDLLDVRVRATSVDVRGDRPADPPAGAGAQLLRNERTYAGYFRHLELPAAVAMGGAKAKLENGLLELEIPKLPSPAGSGEVKVAVG